MVELVCCWCVRVTASGRLACAGARDIAGGVLAGARDIAGREFAGARGS